MTLTNNTHSQQLDFSKVKILEHQLDDVMELIDTAVANGRNYTVWP